MSRPNRIAVLARRDGLDSQALLAEAAAGWKRAGEKVAGILAEDSDEGACSAASLRDIASGRSFPIRLDAAPAGTSCRLDGAGMNKACAGLLPQIALTDVVVLSKTETMRQGLWAAFAEAAAAGKPLLTTVSEKHVGAWKTFAPDAIWLVPDSRSIDAWWRAARLA